MLPVIKIMSKVIGLKILYEPDMLTLLAFIIKKNTKKRVEEEPHPSPEALLMEGHPA